MPSDGIYDISHWQNTPKLGAAKAVGFDAVIIKVTQGVDIADGASAANWQDVVANGFLRGAYHFSEVASGTARADPFLNTVQPDARTLLPLASSGIPMASRCTSRKRSIL